MDDRIIADLDAAGWRVQLRRDGRYDLELIAAPGQMHSRSVTWNDIETHWRSRRRVAVLCATAKSIYKTLPHLDVYDARRDARTFGGGCPVIAHPPCRAWSAFTAHQAKPEPGERELGLWCVEQVRTHGGILEQPAYSRLFQTAGLPGRNESDSMGFTVEVWQGWWGTPTRKRTWLYFAHMPFNAADLELPFCLLSPNGDCERWKQLSYAARSATPLSFARWLVAYARCVRRI